MLIMYRYSMIVQRYHSYGSVSAQTGIFISYIARWLIIYSSYHFYLVICKTCLIDLHVAIRKAFRHIPWAIAFRWAHLSNRLPFWSDCRDRRSVLPARPKPSSQPKNKRMQLKIPHPNFFVIFCLGFEKKYMVSDTIKALLSNASVTPWYIVIYKQARVYHNVYLHFTFSNLICVQVTALNHHVCFCFLFRKKPRCIIEFEFLFCWTKTNVFKYTLNHIHTSSSFLSSHNGHSSSSTKRGFSLTPGITSARRRSTSII